MIVWGRKIVRTPLGEAADFCPICASAQAFEITRVGLAGHLYFISVGEGELRGYERRCRCCGIDLRAEPRAYATLASTALPLAALRQATFPNLDEAYRERLALEERIRFHRDLPPATRTALILEPFELLAPKVTARFETTGIDLNGRFLRTEVLPVLAHALQRLRPSEQELTQALQHMAARREAIGTKVKLPDLVQALAAARTPQGLDTDPAQPARRVGGLAPLARSAKPQRHAAWLLRASGWLMAALLGVLIVARLADANPGDSPGASPWLLLGMAACAWGLVATGGAVARGRRWGRGAGIASALLMLGVFPFGTAAGGYLLWALLRRWPAEAT